MMDIFLAGTAVSLTVSLTDRSGNPLDASAVEYRILRQDGAELLARAPLGSFTLGTTEVTIDVPASLNVLPVIDAAAITEDGIDAVSVRGGRTIELFVTVGGNTVLLSKSYILEPTEILIAGLNSFQTLAQAELTALDVPNLDGWKAAEEGAKAAALIEARVRICQLRFVNIRQLGQSYFSDMGLFGEGAELALLTPTQFAELAPRFKAALFKAQVTEADLILAGDPVDQRRQDGLMLESIGETKQMFRPGKPLDLPVSKRALKYLSPFVSFAKRIGRG